MLDQDVRTFLESHEEVLAMHDDVLDFLKRWIPIYDKAHRGFLTIAVGCTGGQHRSVYMADRLAASLREEHPTIRTRHNEI